MRLRDPSEQPPFHIAHSELFETAYFNLERQFPFLSEAYDDLDWIMSRDPWGNSEPVAAFPERNLRLAVTPRTPRYPSLRVLMEVEVERRRVLFWSLSARV